MRDTILKKKTQKYWLKKLSSFEFDKGEIEFLKVHPGETNEEKFLNYLFNIVSELSFATYEEQKKVKFDVNKLVLEYSMNTSTASGKTIHLETDIKDDTLGIKPKTVKTIISMYSNGEGLEFLPALLWVVNYYVTNSKHWQSTFTDYECNSIDWNKILYDFISTTENDSIRPYGELSNSRENAFFTILSKCMGGRSINADKKSKEFFLQNPYLAPYFFSKKTQVEFKDIEWEIKSRSDKWKKIHNVVPRSMCMLFVSPHKFSTALLPVIEKIFGSKQIGNLSDIAQWKASALIEHFGPLLLELPIEALSRAYIFDAVLGKDIKVPSKEAIDTYLSIFSKSEEKTTTVVSLKESSNILAYLSPEFLLKLSKIEASETLVQVLLSDELKKEFDKDTEFLSFVMEKISPRDLKIINGYYSGVKSGLLKSAYSLWKERNLEKQVPLLKGTVDEYSWEVIDTRNDISGMWLGNATDCCQAFGSAAESCVKAGYLDSYCSFISVTKKGKVYAQTFLWINPGNKFAAFDSIEMLSRSAIQSPKVMKCFLNAAIELINTKENGLDIRNVITGANGTTLPQGLRDYALTKTDKEKSSRQIDCYDVDKNRVTLKDNTFIYSDCRSFYVLASKDKAGKVILSEKSLELLENKGK